MLFYFTIENDVERLRCNCFVRRGEANDIGEKCRCRCRHRDKLYYIVQLKHFIWNLTEKNQLFMMID